MESPDVEEFVNGYVNLMHERGYRPQSAAPWAVSDVVKVVQHMNQLVQTEEGLARVLVARDLFCLTIQWTCVTRGITAVEWCLNDITLKDGMILLVDFICLVVSCHHMCDPSFCMQGHMCGLTLIQR